MAEVQKDTIGSTEDTLRFLDMVGLFGTQAMIALGKLANPSTGKAEKNMAAARLLSIPWKCWNTRRTATSTPMKQKSCKQR